MTHPKIHNLKVLKTRRKKLRNRLTPAEATLWELLKDKKLEGRKFRRQHSSGNYIVDFYCPAERLAIEMDGEPHFGDEGMVYDQRRTDYINSLNITVLRFENHEVFQSPEEVLLEIRRRFKQR